MDVEACLVAVEAQVEDADAELNTVLGGVTEVTQARLWRGQVLVDWEADEQAGDCLLRPRLLRRLLALHAEASVDGDELRIRAPGPVVTSLSPEHADLVTNLGGARRVELRARLRFKDGVYLGGEEAYAVLDRGRPLELLRLTASVRPHGV